MDSVRQLVAHILCPERKGRAVFALVLLAGAAIGVAVLAHSTVAGVIGATLFVAAICLQRYGEPDASGDEGDECGALPAPPPLLTCSTNPMTGASIPAGGVVDSLGYPRGFGPRKLR
jgi:hypothetical protein